MVEIRETPMGGKLKDFLNVVDVIYANDPNFVRPLDLDLKERLDPKKNPFFTHGEGTTFTAYKNGRCVGRITAQIDRLHTEKFKDDTGFWGFFDTIDDPEVAKELLARAERWLKSKGMKRARGPMSLSINEEMGCLVDGFDTPPFILMPHHQKYQAGLIEQAGYEKEKDVFAWSYPIKEMNARVKKAHEELKAMPEVRSRPFSTENLDRDVDIAVEIFNDAWSENWGAVPMTQAEARKLAKDFKMILVPEITRIVEIDGEPAAILVALPNLNELVKDLHGKLFPTGLLKLLYRLKVVGPKTGRLVLYGVRKKFRTQRKYAALSLYLYAEINDSSRQLGYTQGELGWTLEDNAAVNTAIKVMGAKKYKTYRVFGKAIA